MQEQNFEKQVREKMDELSFVPSAPVWENVEEQIRKKKEKRRIIFWLFPLVIVTGLGWWIISENKQTFIHGTKQVATQNKVNNIPEANPKKETQIPGKSNSKKKTSGVKEKTEKVLETTITYLADKEVKTSRKINSPHNNITLNSIDEPIAGKEETLGQYEKEVIKTPVFYPLIYELNADSIIESKSIFPIAFHVQLKDTSQKYKQTKQSKWQIAFAVNGGKSGISEGFGNLRASADMYYYASPTASVGGGFGNAAIPPPSSPKPGAAFSLGVDVKRKMTNRLALVSGLHYSYYSNSIKVGSSVHRDTNIYRFDASLFRTEAFYRNDANKRNYTNRYHYIQLPISAEYKIGKRIPLYVEAGVKIEQLLSTNALFYNQQAGVFVKDNQMIVKTGVQLFSGFRYHFRRQKTFSFAVGPQLQYGITNLSENKKNNQHLHFTGISTQFYLKK